MATISGATNEKVFSLKAFRGLNQNPDGDTKLKMGEAADMYNFRVTRDGNLQRRPGTKTVLDLEIDAPIKGLWTGFVNGNQYMLGACDGKLYKFWDDGNSFAASEIGAVSTEGSVYIFGFSGIVYILDGDKYRQWDGTTYKEVEGYRPLVYIAVPPVNSEDQSSVLENVNRLTKTRRIWISPDGTGTTFKLPEPYTAIDYVKDLLTGEDVDPEDYTADVENQQLIFDNAPPQAVNSYEIGYTVANDFRTQVEHMRYAELFSGQQDTRIFLYGDGSNKCIYSGIDYNGDPRADYFPDLYECLVGDSNTPITSMIRHFASLICYKSNSCWAITANTITLADNLSIPAFYVTPINREIGNAAPGQVRLVLNSPFSLFGNDLYEWKNNSRYASNLTSDERQAIRISDRIWAALENYATAECYCFDDNAAQEYYICYNGNALVYNYAVDAWTEYRQFPVSCMVSLLDEAYIGTPDGKIKHLSEIWLDDDDSAINAYWESGSMGFGQEYMRKYSAAVWLAVAPAGNTEVYVTAITDRSTGLKERVVEYDFLDRLSFSFWDFSKLSFGVTQRPKMKRLKIKAKKFMFYKLVFSCSSPKTKATILAADIRVRYTGFGK